MAVAGRDGDTPPVSADSRIDHGDVHRGREVGDCLSEHGRAAPHVTTRNEVGDVYDGYLRRDLGGNSVTGGGEPVLQPVVGEKRQTAKRGHDP